MPLVPPTNSVGDLRFRLPQGLGPYAGMHNASAFGHSCPQQAIRPFNLSALPKEAADFVQNVKFSSGTTTITTDSEDCTETVHLCPLANIPHRAIMTQV
jgi:acetylcholinesterase